MEEHLHNLKCVFDHLQSAGLCLKPSKCYLVRKEVEYLVYVISDHGMAADPKKIKAVKRVLSASKPATVEIISWVSFLL